MSSDISVFVGLRLNPTAIKKIDELRTRTGASRQEFIRMAVYDHISK